MASRTIRYGTLRKLLIIFLFLPFGLLAETLSPLRGQDQFGHPCSLNEEHRLLLFSHDKAGAHLAMAALEQRWPATVPPLLFLVDTSEVPGWVMSWFMLPKLRRHTAPVCLDPEGALTASLAPDDGEVWLLNLDRLTVEGAQRFSQADALAKALRRVGDD